uniref:ZP domain-containing protein n=1 Tax=Parascaris equorum TaxID=6256 RepID=A0A914RZS3_PAREQ
MSRSQLIVIFCVAYASFTVAIPVDNGVEGEPEIECGPTSITVNFNTRNQFEGHVYVKGLYDQEGCRNDENGRSVAGITLPFDSCNVARTLVISFHPLFVTKVDRAYRIQCFYMEADKTVSTQLEVSEITTAFQTQIWTCDSETVDTFCAIVHSCFVDDGNGDKVELINEDGCALDKYLLNNLEYPTDLMAGQEAHVYKYADRSQLFYQCQIRITIKEPNMKRKSRVSSKDGAASRTDAINYNAQSHTYKPVAQALPIDLRHRARQHYGQPIVLSAVQNGICMSPMGFSMFMGMGIVVVAAIVALLSYVHQRKA